MGDDEGDADPVEAVRTKIQDDIARDGVSIMHVFGEHGAADSYSYTIGLSLKGIPEIAVCGIAPGTARMMLAACKREIDGGWTPTAGVHERIFNVPVRFATCLDWAKDGRTGLVESAGGTRGGYVLLQLLVPDPAGHDPDDGGCDPAYAGVQRFDHPMAEPGRMN